MFIWITPLVNSTVDFQVVFTRNRKEQNKKLFGQLRESDAKHLIGKSNHEAHAGSRANIVDKDKSLKYTKDSYEVKISKVEKHTVDKNIVSKVPTEVDGEMSTVASRVQDAVMTAIENLAIPGEEQTMKSVNASFVHGFGSAVLDSDQGYFSAKIEGLQKTVSCGINHHTNLHRIDETRGKIIVEGVDILAYERNTDRQTHTHHMVTGQNAPQEISEHLCTNLLTQRESI